MGSKLKQHNKQVLRNNDKNTKNSKKCNCNKKEICPLDGDCVHESVIYQARVECLGKKKLSNREQTKVNKKIEQDGDFKPNNIEWYTGNTGGTFKKRFYIHKSNFKIRENAFTNLGKYIWKLKDYGYKYNIKWKIAAKANIYSTATKNCNLCAKEKFFILYKPETATLNDKKEIMRRCIHRWRYKIEHF